MEQMAQKHKENFVRPSLLLPSADLAAKICESFGNQIQKPTIYKAIAECERILQVKTEAIKILGRVR